MSAAPLNQYLSNFPDVPRYEINDNGVEPVYFAEDTSMILKGDQMLHVLNKIAQYRFVAGFILNILKYEIFSINCNEDDIQILVAATGMRRVTTLKHLGLKIND